MFFTWDPALDTGIEIIDQQHRRIVDYINEMHLAIEDKNLEMVADVLDQLVAYTVSHFSFEESLMENHDYMHIKAHKRIHVLFTERIGRYQEDLAAGKDISRKLINELKVWLTTHIQNEDADYVKVIHSKVDKGWVARSLGRFFR